MRKARSSVEEAPSRSPREIKFRACITNELVAADRRFSRGGGVARGGGGGSGGVGDSGLEVRGSAD